MAGITSIDILNKIRNEASEEYQNRIPTATQTNIGEIGKVLETYETTYNEFTKTLVNKIALTLFNANPYENPLKKFKKGKLPYGKTIEDVFVELIKAETYTGGGETVDKRRLPSVKCSFYQCDRKDMYPITISEEQVYEAFRSENGVKSLTAQIVEQMWSSSEYDEYVLMKELIGKATYYTYEVNEPVDKVNCEDFVKAVRKASADIKYMSDKFNGAGVKTHTPIRYQTLFVHKDVLVNIDVDVLSKAFNMGKTDIQIDIVEVDDFGSLTDTYALLVDSRAILVYDKLVKTTSRYNEEGLYTNMFLHIQQLYAMSNYRNAVRFGKPSTGVTSE